MPWVTSSHEGLGLDLPVEVVAHHELLAWIGGGADVGVDGRLLGGVAQRGEGSLGR